jgi:tetratricopeptide (TPR) repeat protein
MLGDEYEAFVAMNYIEALAKTNRYDKVVEQLDVLSASLTSVQLSMVGPTMNTLLRQVGWDLRDQGDFEGSEKIFRKLLEVDPQDAEARAAILHFYSTEEEQAAQQIELEKRWGETDDPHALLSRGGNLLASGDAAGAIDLLRRSVAELPDSEIAWFNLGLAAIQVEDWSLADEAFARATALNPGRAIAFLNHGTALEKLGRCPEAVEVLNRALTLQPDLGQAYYYLYTCFAALGEQQKAVDARKKYNESRQP